MRRIKSILPMFAFSSILLFTGCGHLSFGNVTIKHNKECIYILDEAQLTSLEISGGPDVVVDTTIAKNRVRVIANTEDFSKLVVKAENGKLVISHKRNIGNKEYKVFVPAFDYNAVAVSGGCDLEWNCCDVNHLAVMVSGGADCEIKGKCDNLAVNVSGGADADMDELVAGNVSVVASGGADVELCAVQTISVTASGGSDINIAGTPQISGWQVSGGADVHIDR